MCQLTLVRLKVHSPVLPILICILFFFPACDKSRNAPEGPRGIVEEPQEEPMVTKKEETRQNETGDIPGIQVPIDTLSPEIFVRITIQYRKEHKKWLEEAQNVMPENREEFIEKKNRAFFERLGITEEQYITYGQENVEALNAYIEEHPQLLPEAMDY